MKPGSAARTASGSTVIQEPNVTDRRFPRAFAATLRPRLVGDLGERLQTCARQLTGEAHRHDDRREARQIDVDVQPHDAGAALFAGSVHEDGDVAGRRGRGERGVAGDGRHDAVPRPRCREQDDDAQRHEHAEEHRGPAIETAWPRRRAAHFTRANDVARAIIASLLISLSRVLLTQMRVPPLCQATMCNWSPL